MSWEFTMQSATAKFILSHIDRDLSAPTFVCTQCNNWVGWSLLVDHMVFFSRWIIENPARFAPARHISSPQTTFTNHWTIEFWSSRASERENQGYFTGKVWNAFPPQLDIVHHSELFMTNDVKHAEPKCTTLALDKKEIYSSPFPCLSFAFH